jgi:hypothetical protein
MAPATGVGRGRPASRLRGPDGRARRMVGAAGDITDAKRDD